MRLSITTISATCLIAFVLIMLPSNQAFVIDAIGTFTEESVRRFIHPLWPLGHGKCFNLNRLDPTCPQCL